MIYIIDNQFVKIDKKMFLSVFFEVNSMCDKLKWGFNVLELSVFFGYFDENGYWHFLFWQFFAVEIEFFGEVNVLNRCFYFSVRIK